MKNKYSIKSILCKGFILIALISLNYAQAQYQTPNSIDLQSYYNGANAAGNYYGAGFQPGGLTNGATYPSNTIGSISSGNAPSEAAGTAPNGVNNRIFGLLSGGRGGGLLSNLLGGFRGDRDRYGSGGYPVPFPYPAPSFGGFPSYGGYPGYYPGYGYGGGYYG